jgi:hypothetical protein
MRVKALKTIPISGTYEEIVFDLDAPWKSDVWNYAVFTTSNDDQWLGVFRCNELTNFKIAELDNGIACIVSGGHGFIIDIDNKKKLKDLGIEKAYDVVSDNMTKSFIIRTCYNINRVTENLEEVEIKLPIRPNEIYFDKIERGRLLLNIEVGAGMPTATIGDYYLDLMDMTVKMHVQ